ncbi:hypothetical protein ACLOJK_010370 [Asimina triloba]
MTEQCAMGQLMERQLKERVSLLEQHMGGLAADTKSIESNDSEDLEAKLMGLTKRINFCDVRHKEMMANLESLSDEVTVLKRAFLESGGCGEGRKTKVPNLSSHSGIQNVKELENFLFDMEQYIKSKKRFILRSQRVLS